MKCDEDEIVKQSDRFLSPTVTMVEASSKKFENCTEILKLSARDTIASL